MLRFIKQNLDTMTGVEIFPIIALLLFGSLAIIITIRVIRMSKNEVTELGDYPLDDGVIDVSSGQVNNVENNIE
ncbi:MAG TPA: hypothetical protein VL021_10810 [Brumimicrobium sp.]|nr:hypothetical protein [Brumimicrobium sp.]